MMHDENARRGTLGMVLKGYPRISETFISNEIRLLEERGFRIHIFSMRAPREDFTHESIKHIKAKVTYMPESLLQGLPRLLWRNLLLFLDRPARYLQGVRFMLSRFGPAPKKHTWLKHFLQAGYLIQKGFKAQDIGHFHAHFAHTPTSVAMYAALLGGVQFSFFAHAKDIYTQHQQALSEKLDRAAFAVTCTDYNRRYLQSLAPDPQKISCVYHGIDLSLFSQPDRPPKAMPPYTIMTVARFVPKKGLDTVLAALALLRDKGVKFRYVLAGDGPERDAVKRDIDRHGLGGMVEMVGTVAHERVLAIFREADAFILGCREAENGDRDGIPNVIAESMAMGVPVAATTVSGIPELVQSGESGLLAPPDDPAALSSALERLLTDEQLRTTLIPAARRRVEDVFDNRTLIDRLATVYEQGGIPRTGATRAAQ